MPCCPNLTATIIELPRVAPIAQSFVEEAKLANRVQVLVADILERAPEGRFDAAVLRNLIQVCRLSPAAAVGINLVFLSIYDEGQAYTETEYRNWLAEAGFSDICVQYGAAAGGARGIVLAPEKD